MSDEENKMLEIFKKEVEKEQNEYEQVNEYTKFYYNNHKFILNLIEKQSKEIEELKKYEKYYEEMEEVNKKFIAVDKIKAKIEELKEDIKYSANPLSIDNSKFGIKVLQSLLEKE